MFSTKLLCLHENNCNENIFVFVLLFLYKKVYKTKYSIESNHLDIGPWECCTSCRGKDIEDTSFRSTNCLLNKGFLLGKVIILYLEDLINNYVLKLFCIFHGCMSVGGRIFSFQNHINFSIVIRATIYLKIMDICICLPC